MFQQPRNTMSDSSFVSSVEELKGISLTVSALWYISWITQHASADCFEASLLGLRPAEEAITLSTSEHIPQISLGLMFKLD